MNYQWGQSSYYMNELKYNSNFPESSINDFFLPGIWIRGKYTPPFLFLSVIVSYFYHLLNSSTLTMHISYHYQISQIILWSLERLYKILNTAQEITREIVICIMNKYQYKFSCCSLSLFPTRNVLLLLF